MIMILPVYCPTPQCTGKWYQNVAKTLSRFLGPRPLLCLCVSEVAHSCSPLQDPGVRVPDEGALAAGPEPVPRAAQGTGGEGYHGYQYGA